MLRHRPSSALPPASSSSRRPRAMLVCALIAASVCAPQVLAGEVYQWTDANGVTHYSQTPPPGGGAKYRVISHRQPEAQAPAATAAAEDPQCGVARANIALIEGGGRVQRDTNADGVPDRDLTAVERESQLQLARLVLRTNCTPPAQVANAAQDDSASSEDSGAEETASERGE